MKKRVTHINIRTNPDDKRRLQKIAKMQNISMSIVLRKIIADYIRNPRAIVS